MKAPRFLFLTKWFSQDFLVWARAFALFLLAYTILAVFVSYTFGYILPFLVGLVLAKTAQPVVGFLQTKLRMSRGLATLVVVLLLLLVVFGLIGLVGFLAGRELIAILQRIPEIDPANILAAIETWASQHAISIPNLDLSVWNTVRDEILSFLSAGKSWVAILGSGAISLITSLPVWIMLIIAIVFSTFYFSRDYPRMRKNVAFLFSGFGNEAIQKTWFSGIAMLGKYVRSYLLIYLLTGIQSIVLFLLVGVPYALAWSLLVMLFDVLPVFGPGILYIAMAVYYLVADDPIKALFLGIGWVVIMVVRQIVEPRIVATSIEIHPLSMLAILLIGFQTGSLALLAYLLFLLIIYSLLKSVGLLKPLFPVESTGKRKRLRVKRKPPPDGKTEDSTGG
jgi:sporulation integral membrane protein YtvI